MSFFFFLLLFFDILFCSIDRDRRGREGWIECVFCGCDGLVWEKKSHREFNLIARRENVLFILDRKSLPKRKECGYTMSSFSTFLLASFLSEISPMCSIHTFSFPGILSFFLSFPFLSPLPPPPNKIKKPKVVPHGQSGLGKSTISTHKNDYSQHFVDSGDRPQNYILETRGSDPLEGCYFVLLLFTFLFPFPFFLSPSRFILAILDTRLYCRSMFFF